MRSGTGGAEGELQGTFLPSNILEVALSPTTDELFYLREEGSGVIGITALFSGAGRREAWRSPVREWLTLWPAQETLFLVTKPSALAAGTAIILNRSSSEQEVLLRNIRGLTTLPSPSLARILYSESTDSGVNLFLYERAKKDRREIPLATLPEKCVWEKKETAVLCGIPPALPGGSYPDAWYQGVVSFADDLWKIDPATGLTTLVLAMNAEENGGLDVIKPFFSPDERFLVFTNKTNGTLWSIQLQE